MEGIIIFVRFQSFSHACKQFLMCCPHQAGLYSATLTAFITESQKSLTLDPSDEIAYYARQAVVLLAQISAQLAASGSPVPSTVLFPPAFPQFHAAKSDVRVNIYWFMSLVFSLSAALGATLVQQWAREYVQFFQRYNHPLKRARIRQFLHEGANRWHMDLVVHLVPALIHISLFLFFLGLADSLFKINVATATTTTILIVICALSYLFSIIAPIWDAQSPFQSPLSSMFWHLYFWKFSRRTYKDRSTGGKDTRISTDMKEGRVQLAMSYSEDRKHRDARAIEWIVDDLTEDSELELLVRNIPDSFNSTWGKDVLQAVTDDRGREDPGARFNSILTVSQALIVPDPLKALFPALIIGSRACSGRARIPAASREKRSGSNAPALALVLLYRLFSPWNMSGHGSQNRRSRPWRKCLSILVTSEQSAMRRSETLILARHRHRNSIRLPASVGHACQSLSYAGYCRPSTRWAVRQIASSTALQKCVE